MEVTCPYCGGQARLVEDTEVYGKSYGSKLWVCENFPECDSFVSHNDYTGKPNGTLADSHLRSLRKKAHETFDRLWQSSGMSRSSAYLELAKVLEVPKERAHIGMCDEKQCLLIIEVFSNRSDPKAPVQSHEIPKHVFDHSEFGKGVAEMVMGHIHADDRCSISPEFQDSFIKFVDDAATSALRQFQRKISGYFGVALRNPEKQNKQEEMPF